MGSPTTEVGRLDHEVQHKRRLNPTFALASKSVTLAQYRSLTKDPYKIDDKYIRDLDLPVVGINWYMAANYCNLLSKAEGIDQDQWCYEIKGQVIKLRENYLSLSGYRLPTEAEMEYATRAGAVTSRYYGETEELLGNYVWYEKNSKEMPWPVGMKKPNDFGLFDVQGNCFTWCQESYNNYPKEQLAEPSEDKEDILDINSKKSRVLRDASISSNASIVRSANRLTVAPGNRFSSFGFRPARTVTP